MSDPAVAFIGNYANIVTRKTRSVCVVEVELPIEQMQAFIAAFGAPLPGKEVPLALARLDPSKPASEPRKGNGEAVKERRRFGELPLSQQAAMRCEDDDFRRFLRGRYSLPVPDASEAARIVRRTCQVQSRAQINEGLLGGDLWQKLDRAFLDWKHAVPLAGPAR